MTKKAIIPTVTLSALLLAGMIGTRVVRADENDFNPPIVSQIAEAFGLNEDDVEAVFEAVRDEHHDSMMMSHEERLNEAVENGVISVEQKDALLVKWQEMEDEREAERESNQAEMQAFLDELGIDEETLAEIDGFGMHGMRGHRGMMKP